MAIDIQGLNDNLLKASKNYDEAVRKWVDLALAPAKDVPIEYYDPDGNLIQTTVPNRAKLFNDLLVNVNSAMYRTYYVDAVNGNDGNDGSQTAPFQTIKKAIDSVPAGGVVTIYLHDTSPHSILSNILTNNKILIFAKHPNATTNPKVIFKSFTSTIGTTLYNSNYSIIVYNSRLYSTYIDFEVEAPADPTLPYASNARGFHMSGSDVLVTYSNVSGGGLCIFSSRDNNGAFLLFNCSVTINAGYLIDTNHGTMRFASYNTTYVDSTGATLSPPPVSGLVKDANGTPRNVVSNIVL